MGERPCEDEIDDLIRDVRRGDDAGDRREALERAIDAARADGVAQGRREMAEEAATMLDDRATADARWAKRMDEDGDQHSALVHRVAVEVHRADATRIRALVTQ